MYNGIGLSSVRGTATSGFVQANSSHVRNNRVRRERERNVSQRPPSYNPVSAVAREKGNREIQKHERLRRLENSLMEYRFELEENSKLKDEEIDSRVEKEREKRTKLLEEEESKPKTSGKEEARFDARKHNNRDRGYGDNYRSSNNNNNDNRGGNRGYGNRGFQGDRGYGRSQQYRRNNNNNYRGNTNSHVDATRKEAENKRLADAFGINKEKHVEGQAFDRDLQEQKRKERQEQKEKAQKEADKAKRKAVYLAVVI